MRAVVFSALCIALVWGQEAEVATHYGKVKGTTGTSRNGRMFYSFKGIPYAKAERFQAPEIPANWEGVKDVTGPAPKCIQYNPFKKQVEGQEDCLNLQVHTPKLPVAGKDKILLPVVVYLQPGGHKFFSNEDFDPKYFMDEEVIMVIPNFRLGPFGFLTTKDMYAPGNMGLRDQIQALKWVKTNIEKFGGDKARVTIMGSASGGADAFVHTISPASKGLIHNAIVMSGSVALSRKNLVLNPINEVKKFGQQVGCPIDTSANLVTCLKGKDANAILEATTKFNLKELNVDDYAMFGPTIDTKLPGQTDEDLILPDNPVMLLAQGKIVNKVPLIIGGNENEGINAITTTLLKEKPLMDKLDKQWDELAPTLFMYKDTANDPKVVSAKVRELYFGDKPINEDSFANLTDIFMDRYMGFGLIVTSKLYSKAAPVYLYLFSHTPETSAIKFLGVDKSLGMGHVDDVQFVFKSNSVKFPYPEITKDSKEYPLSQGLVRVLSSFAETGKPTRTWGSGKEWKKIDAGDPTRWYLVGPETTLFTPPERFIKRIGLWTELFEKELGKEQGNPFAETKF